MNPIVKWLALQALKRPEAALIKASGGAARVAGGRTLDPRLQFIEAQARKRPRPAPTPETGRAATRILAALFSGKPPAGVRWSDGAIPAEGRTIATRVYRPETQDPQVPALVFYHFGGGVVGGLDTCHSFCGMLAAQSQGPVVSVDYRLAPEHRWPAGLEDAIAAFAWTAENAQSLGAPAGKAAVGGDSIGGNFAAVVAQEMNRRGGPAPVLQLLIYPAADMTAETESAALYGDAFPLDRQTIDWFMSQYLPEGADLADPRLSPAKGQLAGVAPALIYTAGFDAILDQGAGYAELLRAAGVSVRYRCYDSLCHGFTAMIAASPAVQAACAEIARETAQALRGAA